MQYSITDCHPLHLYDGVEQGTQEWLELREGKITCSNAKDLLLHGPIYCLKRNQQAARRLTPNGNSYADRGHVIEADTKNMFNQAMSGVGYEIADYTFLTNDFFPDAGYSPDGLVIDDSKGVCQFIPVEVKAYNDTTRNEYTGEVRTPNKHIKAVDSFDNVPLAAKCQMQMEMLLTGADRMFLLLANPDCVDASKRFKVWTVNFDPMMGMEISKKLLGESGIFEVWRHWQRSFEQFTDNADQNFLDKYSDNIGDIATKNFW